MVRTAFFTLIFFYLSPSDSSRKVLRDELEGTEEVVLRDELESTEEVKIGDGSKASRRRQMKQAGSVGKDGADSFDDWNDLGLAGAIREFCVNFGKDTDSRTRRRATRRRREEVWGIEINYAGRKVQHGSASRGERECWPLREGEYVTKVSGHAGARVDAIRFHSSEGRSSDTFGQTGASGSFSRTTGTDNGEEHLMGLRGSSSSQEIHQLDFYIGGKGRGPQAVGTWRQLSCHGCSFPYTYEIKTCSELSGSKSNTEKDDWSSGVSTEVKAGFEVEGIGASTTTKVSANEARSIVQSQSNAFKSTSCSGVKIPCDKTHFYQFEWTSEFDGRGRSVTHANSFVCTHESKLCCLPGDGEISEDSCRC